MKKVLLLLVMVIVALVIDGTMTYDIFEFRKETAFGWSLIGLGLLLFLIVILADNSKKSEKEDTSR